MLLPIPRHGDYTGRRNFQMFVDAVALRRAGMAQRASPTVQGLEDVDIRLGLNATWNKERFVPVS